MVTIKEIAETAGVSIATVSRVLSKSDYPVSQKTRSIVLQVASDLGYSPNLAARSLRTDRSSLIGVILDNFSSNWASFIIRGIQDVLHQNGYFSLVVNIPWETHSQADVVQDLMGHSVEGFMFVETWHPISEWSDILNNKPYVFVHRLFHQADHFSVIPDELHNSSLMIQHLLNLGHKKIAYIAGPENYFSSEQRLTGYKTTLEHADIPVKPDWIVRGNWRVKDGYLCAERLLSLDDLPTAIATANDQLAYGALLAAQDKGLKIPDDIAIVGYDNDEIARISNPTITTVTLPLFEMGQVAAENLLHQVNNEEYISEEQLIKGKLIVRQSCGSAQGKHIGASDFERD